LGEVRKGRGKKRNGRKRKEKERGVRLGRGCFQALRVWTPLAVSII